MKKKVFVFIHGLFSGPDQFYDLYKDLDEDYLTITLPGHLKSPFIQSNWSDYSRDLSEKLKDLRKDIYLVGYSMGGRVCLSLLDYINPKSLFLIAPNPGLDNQHEMALRLEKDKNLITDKTLRSFLKKWYQSELFSLTRDQQNLLIEKNSRHEIDQIKKALDFFSLGRQDDYRHKMQSSSFPIDYLYGEYDQKYKVIASNLGESVNIHEIKKSGHNPLLQNIEQVRRIFKNFSQT